eukprot:CFRG6922T1
MSDYGSVASASTAEDMHDIEHASFFQQNSRTDDSTRVFVCELITSFLVALKRQSLLDFFMLWCIALPMVYLKLSHPQPRKVLYVNWMDYAWNHDDSDLGINEYLTYDPSISKPHVKTERFPSWAGYVCPMLLFYVALFTTEIVIQRLQVRRNLTTMWSSIFFFLQDSAIATCVAMLLAEILKTSVGTLRPDFLSRCKPDSVTGHCTASNLEKIVKGRYSFPSGHATSGFAFAIYCTIYMVWTWYVRVPAEVRELRIVSVKKVTNTLAGIGFYYSIGTISFAWAMGATRVNDNRHSIADVIAGAILGGIFGAAFSMRSVLLHDDLNVEEQKVH